MSIISKSHLLVIALLSVIKLGAADWSGDYRTLGTHPWSIEVTNDNKFTVTYSDAGGIHQVEGIWKEHEDRLFLLERKSDNYQVFRIISADQSGEFTMEAEEYAVIDTIGSMPSCRCPEEGIIILKPRFKLIKEISNK